ncbi:MAG: site-specific DNA-methyltransferase [Eubacteriales bacterium]
MTKPRFESPDLTSANIDNLAALFPSVITEARGADGQLRRAVNFDKLRQLLGDTVAEGDEAYEFTWVGKKAAIAEAGRPIRKTLRPCPEESKNWDTTENLYIEGDNLEVLKLLQESYLGKVKMIYIDPPYNTGNDFVYRDNFTQSKDEYEEEAGVYNEEGERLFHNTESNGRFHSDWCSMIYPRLTLARNLLRDDGVIFISIDDNEVAQLRKICDEVFGEANFIDIIVWEKKASAKGVPPRNMMVNVHEYLLAYQKSDKFKFIGEKRDEESDGFKNPDNDPRGPWRMSNIKSTTKPIEEAFTIIDPNTGREYTNTWAFSKESLEKMIAEDRILWKDTLPKQKEFMLEMTNENKAIKSSWGVFDAQSTTVFLKKLIPEVQFENPKPIPLMKYLLGVVVIGNDLILDFFSGSATTAQAVMQLNAEDNGSRKFIMVQLPEVCTEDTEAVKAGYKNICEIGKERIRRAGDKIKADNKDKEGIGNLDIGFRVLKLDSTNMKDVYYSADEYDQTMLGDLESNIKDDRSDMDLLYGCLLDWALPLSMPHTQEQIEGVTIHTYNDGDLIACFAERVSEKVVREIARRQPLRIVFRDSSFASSPEKINVEEIFKLLAPNTSVRVI